MTSRGRYKEESMSNAVSWFDLGGPDDKLLIDFYGALFGWSIQPLEGMNYSLIDTGGREGANGGIGKSGTGDPWATFYVEVEELQDCLDRASSMGAEIVVPVTEIPGFGSFAMFNDPDGLLVGLSKGDGTPPERGPSDGDGAAVDWFEVLGKDAGRTQSFYTELFNWKLRGGADDYEMVDTGAGYGMRGGLGGVDGPGWATIYASVGDVEATLVKAQQLGATIVYGPREVPDGPVAGAFKDPAGSVFGVYKPRR
jgi:predicted enzyme related to lactoylglutathione lyase